MKNDMHIAIIHLSDLHYRHGWIEDQGVVLDGFFKDLDEQIRNVTSSNIYLVFSGDIVQEGADAALYDNFILEFNDKLNKLNIRKNQRICIPGNHDISLKQIEATIFDHEGIVSQYSVPRKLDRGLRWKSLPW